MIKLITVQIKGSNTQFSTPLYMPPGHNLFYDGGFGVRIAVWFRCSLNKQATMAVI
jgi:hypothetical protein